MKQKIALTIITSLLIFNIFSCNIFKKKAKIDDNANTNVNTEVEQKVEFQTTATMRLVDSLRRENPMPKYTTYHFKGKIRKQKNKYPVNGVIAVKRDSLIWLSIRPGLGIEVARVYLFTENIYILDRVNSKFMETSYNQLSRRMKININYKMLQSLFLAKLFTIDNYKEPKAYRYSHALEGDTIKLFRPLKDNKKHLQIIAKNARLLMNNIQDSVGQNIISMDFKYSPKDSINFPNKIKFQIANNQNINLDLKVFKYSEKKRIIPKFDIPTYYRQTENIFNEN